MHLLAIVTALLILTVNHLSVVCANPGSHWEWKWSTESSSPMQCPCVLRPGTNECFQYDSRYQATNIEEAITFFVDPTLDEAQKQASDEGCPQCKINCERLMREKLRSIGMLEGKLLPAESNNRIETSGAECQKYRFTLHDKAIYDYGIIKGTRSGRTTQKIVFNSPKGRGKVRARRQATSALLGTPFNLSCVRKGVTPDSEGLLDLCSRCWTWRRLPKGYFPQLINEFVCDDQDTMCLSGYGKCKAGHRVIEVIRMDLPKPTTVTLQSQAYCDCKLKAGSALESLVVGTDSSNSG